MSRHHLHFLLVAVTFLIFAVQPQAQDYHGRLKGVIPEQAPSEDAILLDAGEIVMWKEGDLRVFDARKDVDFQSPAGRIRADRAIIFFEEAPARDQGLTILHLYAEGSITLWERARELHPPTVFRTYRTNASFTVSDADRDIAELDSPDLSAVYTRAVAARTERIVPPSEDETIVPEDMPTPAPPASQPADADAQPIRVEPVVVPPPEEGIIVEPADELRVQVFATQSAGFSQHLLETDDEVVAVFTGGIDILLEGREAADFEIVAENAVIWFYKSAEESGLRSLANLTPKAAYAEGNVVMFQGRSRFQAPRLVHDFQLDRSLIYDAVMKSEVASRGIPLVYRAALIKQHSRDLFVGQNAKITNSESPQPNVYFTAAEFRLENLRPEGDPNAPVTSTVVSTKHNVVRAGRFPIAYWPSFKYATQESNLPLRSVRISESSNFGTSVETLWDLYKLGFPQAEGADLNLMLDYFSARGPGVGIQSEYEFDDSEGSFLGYYLDDIGTDGNGFVPPRSDRGRAHWLHRQFIGEDTTADIEISYLSDAGLLTEFFEREAKTEKTQETLAYIKKLRDKWGLTALATWRLNDFQSQVEYLPKIGFEVVGLSLLNDHLTFDSSNQVANLRNRPSKLFGPLIPSNQILRFDSLNEIALPLSLGPVEFTPFVEGRFSYFDDTVSGAAAARTVAAFGFRATSAFHRVYDKNVRLLDINGIRHIIVPEVIYRNVVSTSESPSNLFQFDSVDAVTKMEVFSLGLRQRWQTKRGPRARSGKNLGKRRIVDFATLDLEVNLYPQKDRDNGGDLADNFQIDSEWLLSDYLSIVSETEFNLADGRVDLHNYGLRLTKSPRLRFYIGNHYVRVGNTNAWEISTQFQATPRWDIRLASQYNFDRSAAVYHEIVLRRFFESWIIDTVFAFDQGESDTIAALVISPRGLPETATRLRAW